MERRRIFDNVTMPSGEMVVNREHAASRAWKRATFHDVPLPFTSPAALSSTAVGLEGTIVCLVPTLISRQREVLELSLLCLNLMSPSSKAID